MKKVKKCFRSVTGDNFDPANCIREECAAWVKIDKLEGCSFVLQAVTTIIKNIDEGGKGTQETEDDTNSTDNTQCKTGRIGCAEGCGKELNNCDPTTKDAIEQIERYKVREEVIKPIASGEATIKPIDDGEYKGDPA